MNKTVKLKSSYSPKCVTVNVIKKYSKTSSSGFSIFKNRIKIKNQCKVIKTYDNFIISDGNNDMNNINDNVMIEKEIKDYDHRSISSFSKSNLRKLDTDSKKKLEKLKEYENSVVNFSNLEKIFNKSNKNLNVENNHETTILKKDNSHPKSKSKIKSLSSTKLIKTNILFSSSSKNQSIKNLAGSKGLDMIKNRLYEIYKTNPTEENKVQRVIVVLYQVKKMKNLDLNEYQKRLVFKNIK